MPVTPAAVPVFAAAASFAMVAANTLTQGTRWSGDSETSHDPLSRQRMDYIATAVSGGKYDEARRLKLKKIAQETVDSIKEGYYPFKGVDQELGPKVRYSMKNTQYYSPDSPISHWATTTPDPFLPPTTTHISVLHITTLDAARLLQNAYKNNPMEVNAQTGVLNFASATKPGGGFKNGAEAQEESIARSSTLYNTLVTDEGMKFYKLHKSESAQNAAEYYSHAIIYSPRVTVFRDDDGEWTYPFDIDVISCAAVNAGQLKKALSGPTSTGLDVFVEKEMSERMGRILYVFEQRQVRNIVLGTFGTGVFRNSVATVARIWAQLLILPDARFKSSFDRVIFAITGEGTFADFQSAFDAWGQHRAPGLRSNRGVMGGV